MESSNSILVKNSKGKVIDKPYVAENNNWFDYKEPFRKSLKIDGVRENEFYSLLDETIEEVSIYAIDKEVDLGFVSQLPNLKALSVTCLKVKDIEILHELKKLESLHFMSVTNQNLSLNLPDNLKVLSIEWKSKYTLETLPKTLECLYVVKGKKLNWDTLLADKPNLLKVELIDCDISNGDTLCLLPTLRYLSLTGCRKVQFSGTAKNDSIGFIDFRGIPMTSLNWLAPLSTVEIICIYNAGILDTIEHLRDKKSIIGLMLSGNTALQDGDLSALETLENLKNCFFVSKRHYTHKSLEPWNWKNFGLARKKVLTETGLKLNS